MNRQKFYNHLRKASTGLFSGKLSKKQVKCMEAILDAFVLYGDGKHWSLAYILATVRHEVGIGMAPVRESFAKSDIQARARLADRLYARPINGISYYGRGFIQLTHEYNYRKLARRYKVDLVNKPDLALEPELAARILVEGIICGDFNPARKGISYYLNGRRQDLKNARRTVNLTDRWQNVAYFYHPFLEAIMLSGGVPTCSGSKRCRPLPTRWLRKSLS